MGLMKKFHWKTRIKLGGALAAGGICLLCGFFSVGMFAEPEAAPTNPLTRVAGAADAVRIEAPQGTPGAMESCGALIAQQSSGRDLEILLDVLTQTQMA